MKKWRVSKAQAGLRLIDFLAHYETEVSKKALKKQIESGAASLNGTRERFASKALREGDWVQYKAFEEKKVEPLQILYEDEHLLVINKPAGLSCDKNLAVPKKKIYLVHRLDKETSGALLLAKTAEAEARLLEQFKGRDISKEYWAIVDGSPKESEGMIKNRIGKLGAFSGQTLYGSLNQGGLEAVTLWKVLKTGKRAALVACFPETGRTHQLRVHLKEMGHPILGDLLYGREVKNPYRPKGMLLHARRIGFQHPISQRTMSIEAPLSEAFEEAMQNLW